jgi:DNA helicase-2/ATP-dependent DNA helicase PcrA
VGIELGITGESLRSASQLISSLETIHLDEVFRSSYSVVDISNALRRDRSRSAVGSKSGKGSESVVYFLAFDEHEEARYIIDEITMIRRDELLAQNDFCILYRTQSQALFLEEQLRQNGIRFRSLARSVVYAHSEIRDIILYLRVLFNPADRQAMAQLLALPPFQLTEAEIEPIIRQAAHSASGVFEFTNDDDISDTVKTKMIALIDLINHWRIQIEEDPDTIAGVILAQIADESGYRMLLEEENTLDSLEQLQTIDEFIRTSLENEWSVEQLLNHLAVSHFDDSTEVSGDAVTLLPLRAAKEYEFRCVFVCGLEEGLIPHYNAQFQPDALDEERRLLYIGISRATQHLILTSAFKRSMFGAEWYDDVSRFIKEIPRDRLACFLSDRLAESHEILVEGLRRDGFYIQTWLPSALDLETPRDARFAVGDVIEHQRWGRGVIQSIDGADDNLMLQIQFNDQERKLMAKYADVIKV